MVYGLKVMVPFVLKVCATPQNLKPCHAHSTGVTSMLLWGMAGLQVSMPGGTAKSHDAPGPNTARCSKMRSCAER